jgi:hypothetical protein
MLSGDAKRAGSIAFVTEFVLTDKRDPVRFPDALARSKARPGMEESESRLSRT